jgi:hypothetical protein
MTSPNADVRTPVNTWRRRVDHSANATICASVFECKCMLWLIFFTFFQSVCTMCSPFFVSAITDAAVAILIVRLHVVVLSNLSVPVALASASC